MTVQTEPVIRPFRLFTVAVARTGQLSPSFRRVTVTGPDLDRFADNGYDQRFKLVLPPPGQPLGELDDGPDWYAHWIALPAERRPAIRTYTVRSVRPELREVDIDIVCHPPGPTGLGPAATWVATAAPGDELALIGPDAAYPGPHGGVDFRPPADATGLLLAGDETAAPAVLSIMERLPADARGHAILEVPQAEDWLPVTTPPGITLTWLSRDGAAHGSQLLPVVTAAAAKMFPGNGSAIEFTDIDVDTEILWEVPEEAGPGAPYAWLAGEASVIRSLRRRLVADLGVDRRSVAFMGYWRTGRAEDNG